MKKLSLLVLVAMGLFISLGSINAAADTWTQTTQADFESGTLENLNTTSSPGDVKLKLLGDEGFDWTVAYTADALPEDSDPVWIKMGDRTGSVENGILTLTLAPTQGVGYKRNAVLGPDDIGNTFEIRVKMGTDLTGNTNMRHQFGNGSWYQCLHIYMDRIYESAGGIPICYMDTTDDYHIYRVTMKNQIVKFYVDGELVHSTTSQHYGNNYVSWDLTGTAGDAGSAKIDYVKYYTSGSIPSSGTLTSLAYDAGASANWGTISWTADTSAQGTSIKFRTRTSPDGSSWSPWSDYYTESGSSITSPSYRWIQYEATLETTNAQNTPILSDVTISYTVVTPPLSTWTQTDWSGGPGQPNWIDPTKYNTGTDIDTTSSPGYVKLKYLEDLDWTVNYTADALPENSDPAWGVAVPGRDSVANGILTIDVGWDALHRYHGPVGLLSDTIGTTAETRLKMSDTWPNPTNWSLNYTAEALPDASDPAWVRSGTGAVSVSGGILDITTNSDQIAGYDYRYYSPSYECPGLSPDERGNIGEVRVKIMANSTDGYFLFRMSSMTRRAQVQIFEDKIVLGCVASAVTYNMNTTDDFHTYKLVEQNNLATVYVDGIERLTGTEQVIYDMGTKVWWGAFSASANPNFHAKLDYLKYYAAGHNRFGIRMGDSTHKLGFDCYKDRVGLYHFSDKVWHWYNIDAASAFHIYRVTLKDNTTQLFVDGTLQISVPGGGTVDNFLYFQGYYDSISYVDYFKYYTGGAIGYFSSGILTSSVYDAGASANWGTISWIADTSAQGTSVKFRTRTSPDGFSWSSWSDYYTTSGFPITSPNNRWIQYEATLETTDPQNTPVLSDVTISYITNAPPGAPTLSSPENEAYTNDTTPTFTWNNATDPDNNTLTYQIQVDNGSDFSSPEIDASGITEGATTTSYTPSATLADGTYWWQVRANDGTVDGPWSATWSFILDATPPPPPDAAKLVVAQNPPGTQDAISGLAGAVEADSIVKVYSDAGLTNMIGSTTANADGSFPSISIGDNLYGTIWVTATDAAGNESTATSKDNDIIAPDAPIVDSPTSPTNTTPITVTGTAEAGSTVEVFVNGGSEGTTTATAAGTFSLPNVDLNEGNNSITATATDAAGNISPSSTPVTVVLDTVPPTVISITVTPDPAPALLPGWLEFKLIFNESMNTSITPTVSYDPEGATVPQPCSSGSWSTTNNPHDTYTVYNDNEIDKTTGDGVATISVSDAQDLAGNVMAPDTNDTFIINARPIAIQNQGAFPLSFNPLEPPEPLEGETTTISYVLSESAVDVDITITDGTTTVRNLVTDMPKDGGLNIVDWDGKNDAGNFVIIPGEKKKYDATIYAQGSLLPGDFVDKTISNIWANSTLPVIKIISDDDPIFRYATPPENAATISYETNAPGDNITLNRNIKIWDSVGNVIFQTGFENEEEGLHTWTWDTSDAITFPEGMYQYEILTKTLPPKPLSANPKAGTIVILDQNNIEPPWSSADGDVKVNSPATGPTITITKLSPEEEPTEATKAILTADPSLYLQSPMYDIIADPETDFVPPAILTFSYDPALDGEIADKLQIRYFDTATNSWVPVERQYIDIVNHQVIAEIDKLSLFALFTCDDTTPPVVTITSPEAKEYHHTTDGEPTIINITYTAQDPVVSGFSSGVVKEIVLLNGEVYEYETIDLSTLLGENTLTVKAIDKAGNTGQASVKFTVVLVAQVTIKPEALKVTPGVLTAYVEFPEGYNVADIVDATCDGAAYERMMLNDDATVMIIKFRRNAIEEALSLLDPPQSIDTTFKVRGTAQDVYGSYIFESTDTIMKVLEGSAPPEKGKGKPR